MRKKDGGVEDPLLTETHHLIGLGDDIHHAARSLKYTTHLKAMSTALQMTRSHHAVGVEAAAAVDDTESAPDEDTLDLFREAANHHLCAYKVICEIRRLREASRSKASKGKAKPLRRFKGVANVVIMANRIGEAGGRLTAHGHNLGLVSFAIGALLGLNQNYCADKLLLLLVAPHTADQSNRF